MKAYTQYLVQLGGHIEWRALRIRGITRAIVGWERSVGWYWTTATRSGRSVSPAMAMAAAEACLAKGNG